MTGPKDHVTAAEGSDVAACLQFAQKRVVVRRVVGQDTAAILDGCRFVIAPALYPMLLALVFRARPDYLITFFQTCRALVGAASLF